MSLDLLDLAELGRSKEKYRMFVELQAESLESIMRDSYLDGSIRDISKDTVTEFLQLLTRLCIDKNKYRLSILQSSCLMLEMV